MKKIYLIALLLVGGTAFSQIELTSKFITDMPQIAPPSPTVAGLMKFEEVPVSNYTGIPDISIPFYSVASHSKDIALNLGLKYHPGSTAVEEISGFTGLGWNLMAGGTISRTVRGLPDEIQQGGGRFTQALYGIHTQGVVTYANNYYQIQDFLGSGMSPAQALMFSEFLWETYEKGRYDTEHDLYQYSFMGHSGRFYLSYKNGIYEVVKLDNDNAMSISYNSANKSFTLFDDKGYKYIFDIKEETTQANMIQSTYFDGTGEVSNPSSYSYTSAFHLSGVYDTNNKQLIELVYNATTEPIKEMVNGGSTVTSAFIGTTPSEVVNLLNSRCGQVNRLQAQKTISMDTRTTLTRKLRQVRVVDIAKIDFTLEAGRQDTNNIGNYLLKQITVKDWYDVPFKKIEFNYTYSEVKSRKRLLLSQVAIGNFTNSQKEVYKLSYANTNNAGPSAVIGKDYWGYYNRKPYTYSGMEYKETDPQMCKMDVLQKMTLPTGGAVVFNFESNTYAHIGNQPVTNFDGNPDNFVEIEEYYVLNSSTSPECKTVSLLHPNMEIISFNVKVVSPGSSQEFEDMVWMTRNGVNISGSMGCNSNNPNCSYNFNWQPGDYSLCFANYIIGASKTANVTVTKRYRKNQIKQFLYGGGLRIATIGYFDNENVAQNHYDFPDEGYVPSKQKNYDYSQPQNPAASSGALVLPKPIFEYSQNRHYTIDCASSISYQYDYSFKITTDFNNLKVVRTQGSDVGYSNVAVSETGNGVSRYVYTSPKEYPEDNYETYYPFMPSLNYDYKRGLLTNEQHFRQNGSIVAESQYDYAIEEDHKMTGMKIFSNNNCRFAYKYTNHLSYYTEVQQCGGNCPRSCGYPVSYISYGFIQEYFGWAKLIQKKTYDYLQDATVSTTDSYTYNPINKQVASHTMTNSFGENQTMNYTYHTGNSPYSQNRISELATIETKVNNEVLSVQQQLYSGSYALNSGILPSSVAVAKGGQSSIVRLRFNSYDEVGNLLEAQQENGTKISYVWGYGKSQVIAKIENVAYSSINAGLITAAQNASNTAGASGLEAALTNLRNSLPNAMVSTYTYKPGIGVSTVTDAKGDRVSYTYDAFGRLSVVKDKSTNILSINDYHYRTQN